MDDPFFSIVIVVDKVLSKLLNVLLGQLIKQRPFSSECLNDDNRPFVKVRSYPTIDVHGGFEKSPVTGDLPTVKCKSIWFEIDMTA